MAEEELLGGETLQTILAILGILLLAYLLGSLYNNKVTDSKLVQAKAVLTDSEQSINKILSGLDNGENFVLNVVTPKSWLLKGYAGTEKPNSCAGQDCICICQDALIKNQAVKCDEEGTCLIEKDLAGDFEIKIAGGDTITKVNISKEDNKIFFRSIG